MKQYSNQIEPGKREPLYFKSSAEWRDWLSHNHDKETGIWLLFYKKETGKPSLRYEEAVEEALCFGWIDSIIKKLDGTRYTRKFTPRKDDSKWSEKNKRRVARLIKSGRMAKAGMAKILIAKQNGHWDKPDRPVISFELPLEFEQALSRNRAAREFFEQLAPGYQKQFIAWIAIAKRAETKEKRIIESIQLLESRQKLGMK